MDILTVQTLCLLGLFISTLLLTLLPFRIIGRQRDTSKSFYGKYENLVSYANCLSGGVFLATFFVGLLPEVRVETKELLESAHLTTSIPVTEVMVLIGFFLAMLVEQLAMSAKDFHKAKKRKKEANHVEQSGPPGSDKLNCEQSVMEVNDTRTSAGGTAATSLVASAGNNEEEEDVVNVDDDHLEDNCNQLVSISQHSPCDVNHADHNSLDKHLGHDHIYEQQPCNHEHDHGHGHSHHVDSLISESTAGVRLGMLLLSLGVHCMFEGMALGLQDEIHTLVNLFIGVWIHECLIALALGFSMVRARPKPCRMWQIALFFSSLIPLGQIVGIVIGSSQSWTSHVVSTILQGIAAGTFVQVTFLDIIPEGLGPVGSPKRLSKVGLLFLGFIIITTVSLLVETFNVHAH